MKLRVSENLFFIIFMAVAYDQCPFGVGCVPVYFFTCISQLEMLDCVCLICRHTTLLKNRLRMEKTRQLKLKLAAVVQVKRKLVGLVGTGEDVWSFSTK